MAYFRAYTEAEAEEFAKTSNEKDLKKGKKEAKGDKKQNEAAEAMHLDEFEWPFVCLGAADSRLSWRKTPALSPASNKTLPSSLLHYLQQTMEICFLFLFFYYNRHSKQ